MLNVNSLIVCWIFAIVNYSMWASEGKSRDIMCIITTIIIFLIGAMNIPFIFMIIKG